MQYKLPAIVIFIIINFSYSAATIAASNPPLDVIELLGEIEDDSMLAAALSDLDKKPVKSTKLDNTQTSSQQYTDTAKPIGGNKK